MAQRGKAAAYDAPEALAADWSRGVEGLHVAWSWFERQLARDLERMRDPEGHELLRLHLRELPENDIHTPAVQFVGAGGGTRIRAELVGDFLLRPEHRLGRVGAEYLTSRGWQARDTGLDSGPTKWWTEVALLPADAWGVDLLARQVAHVLRTSYGIVHPDLLARLAFGPGLERSEHHADLETDPATIRARYATAASPAVIAASREELRDLIEAELIDLFDEQPQLDDDGDFRLLHNEQQILWVSPRADQPTIEIAARVAHDVPSERDARVELSRLNDKHMWVNWTYSQGAIWQNSAIPAQPFAPAHFRLVLEAYLKIMDQTRAALAQRLGASLG